MFYSCHGLKKYLVNRTDLDFLVIDLINHVNIRLTLEVLIVVLFETFSFFFFFLIFFFNRVYTGNVKLTFDNLYIIVCLYNFKLMPDNVMSTS